MLSVDINCDLGEGFGVYRTAPDEQIFPLISSANIACGFQAGGSANHASLRRVGGQAWSKRWRPSGNSRLGGVWPASHGTFGCRIRKRPDLSSRSASGNVPCGLYTRPPCQTARLALQRSGEGWSLGGSHCPNRKKNEPRPKAVWIGWVGGHFRGTSDR